jgi:hypothetical protein
MSAMKKKARKTTKKPSKKQSTAVKSYQNLIAAGIGFVERWATAVSIPNDALAVLGSAVAYVDAVVMGNAPNKVRRNAIALALRAAYLYGKLDGKLPKKEKPRVIA